MATKAKANKKASATPEPYDNPTLRNRLKGKILRGVKGGRAGQWSARKAQLLAHEYEAAGGGYTAPRSASQKHLKKWGDEKWTTRDGKPAKRAKGTMARYLPKKAWATLSPDEQKATDQKKQTKSRKGKQFVANTKLAKRAVANVRSASTRKEK